LTTKGRLYSDVIPTPFHDERALKSKLTARIRAVVAEAGPQDTIMLFAAAHGDQGRDGKFYLVTRDTEKANLENTAIAWDDIAAALQGVRARVVVFLDACRSGAAGQVSGTNDDAVAALLARDAPITVIAASKGRQDSEELKLPNGFVVGAFTSELVNAVVIDRAKTDTNANGAIELAELYGAIKPRVVAATANNGDDNKQTPWIARNQMVGEIPLF
ncbi:MAG: caspase family protein, partial [Pseudomonadota bacterium]